MLKLFIFSFFFSSQLFAQNDLSKTGSNLKTADADAILAHHNNIRTQMGIPPLAWSESLSAYAQKWADFLAKSNNCAIKHRQDCGENGMHFGENIFWGSSAKVFSAIDASNSWYGEKKEYRYQKLSLANYHGTGHYTQMIWKDTQKMGVGMSICDNGSLIIVANYYPAGNMIGEYPY
jgi:pathogenesis-related protein 1